jgi:serine/threonine protein phosphatase PrpC
MLELPDGLAIALADGVSTSCHAKVAADLAVQTALQSLQNTIAMPGAERIACAIQRAHEAVCALPHDNVQLAEPQATLVLALVSGERLWYGWIGDSRLYVSDQHTATQLTIDDSWLNEQLSAGVPVDTAQKDANAHCIVQCLGMRDDQIDIHVGAQILPVNATVLVCSDGLWNYCDEPNTLWALCEQHQQAGTPVQQCIKLVDFANAAGGQDNITVALYRQTLRS